MLLLPPPVTRSTTLAQERRAAQLATLASRLRPGEDMKQFLNANGVFWKDHRDVIERSQGARHDAGDVHEMDRLLERQVRKLRVAQRVHGRWHRVPDHQHPPRSVHAPVRIPDVSVHRYCRVRVASVVFRSRSSAKAKAVPATTSSSSELSSASMPGMGRSFSMGKTRTGENRVEA